MTFNETYVLSALSNKRPIPNVVVAAWHAAHVKLLAGYLSR